MDGRREPGSEILGFLCGTPLFSCIQGGSARLLASAVRLRRAPRGEIIFFVSDMADAALVIRSGTIAMVLNSPDGREMVIDELHAGEMFGELELLTREPRTACAVARSNCELLVIPSVIFLQILAQEPCLVRRVLETTAERLQASTRRQMELVFMDARARLARNLLELDEQQRGPGFITISQDELASGAGLIRQTVAKALGEWRRSGWLLTGRGRIVVLNRKALEKVARAGFD